MKVIFSIIVIVALALCVMRLSGECSTCGGAGKLDGTKEVSVKCKVCRGSGKVAENKQATLNGAKGVKKLGSSKRQCFKCKGVGKVEKLIPLGECDTCSGTGSVALWKRFVPGK